MRRSGRVRDTGRAAPRRGFSLGLFAVLLLFLVALAGLGWVSMGIVTRDRWPIRWLEIHGAFQRISAEQVRSTLAPLAGSSFFTVELDRLRQAASRSPWVAGARVEKRWPDTVIVTLEEFAPVAHWNSGELISTLHSKFAVPEADSIQGLPWLSGPDERLSEVVEQWQRFDAMLNVAGMEIERLKLDQRGSWSMELSSGTRVQLGRDAAAERLERMLAGWRALLNGRSMPPVVVDLRYANGFAVLWPGELTELAINDD